MALDTSPGSITLALLIALYISYLAKQLLPRNEKTPPVVFHWFPWFGSMIVYGLDPYAFFFKNRRKYGNVFSYIMGGRTVTCALGTAGNSLVLSGKLSQISAAEAYSPLTTPVFGKDVVYDVPNPIFMEQKKFIKFGLTTQIFCTYVPLIVDEYKKYVDTTFIGTTGTANLRKTMPELTIFTASRSLQGKEVREAFDESFAQLYHDLDRGFTPLNMLFPYLPLPSYRRRDRAHQKMEETYFAIIRKRRELGSAEVDMIDNLMNQKYKDGRNLSDEEIAHIMIALLMAGQHTSSATIAWTLLHIGNAPDILEDLYQEQKQVLGDEPLSYDKLKDLKLANDVIRETLRLHPPLHSLIRKVVAPIEVPDSNMVISPGSYVLAAPGVTAIDQEHWERPLEFMPKRWETCNHADDNTDKIDYGFGLVSRNEASPYLPFGAGRHRCVGEQFAYLQLVTLLTCFVREFKWALVDGAQLPAADYSTLVALPNSRDSVIAWSRRN